MASVPWHWVCGFNWEFHRQFLNQLHLSSEGYFARFQYFALIKWEMARHKLTRCYLAKFRFEFGACRFGTRTTRAESTT